MKDDEEEIDVDTAALEEALEALRRSKQLIILIVLYFTNLMDA
jgi:hypothetical protein